MAIEGVCIAPDDDTLEATPAWERIDEDYIVQAWTIDRGRSYELDRTGTGVATIDLFDINGDFNPVNSDGEFFGRLDAMTQAAIALQNPSDSSWSTLFRGFVTRIEWEPYVTETVANVRLYLVDALALLAAAEMTTDGTYGSVEDGNIVYLEDGGTDAVKTRIDTILTEFDWPTGLREIFSGNVKLKRTVYAPRSPVLTVIQDAADAEFPGVANVYVQKDGKITFHGRLARFDPTEPTYHIAQWSVGDQTAVLADPTNVVLVSPPLIAFRDDDNLYTTGIATPQEIADADIAGQYVEDATAKAKYGTRTWSAENLLTDGGTGTTALQETKKFATYYVDNYKIPRTRVGALTIKALDPDDDLVWALTCGVDISDVVHLQTAHAGGGGFNDDFFVEGVHYEAVPLADTHPQVTLTLDVSPTGYWDSDPF